ncbi:WcaF family extracellular polysaccharide biosynthesis acetyltransferase [Polaribacter sp. HaHaR_3_91]|uniref:WcaF family extracellular polysaccharide biosynthesis acetyltransferase n=1 Tax=Polaribacter sp. HaHaR_3_91 TaxID=2745561 RepID=UPI001C502151|nr:WcaF family extracellular polysaccharide biosynthesis acetyltransferase [Polaribacter sp. HaHaR_3_91]QXP64483.1 colanic acid biosynthesis acetyltransferase WcaF [Polaribacter sp. HaHaR_3_91]
MKKVKLSNYNNDWYKPGSKIKILIWYYINIFFLINPLNPISSLKIFILRLFGAKIGNNVAIKQSVNVKYPWLLEVGDNVWVGENVWIDNLAKVKIEDNVCISQGAMLLCGNHDYKKSSFDLLLGEITLKKGSWVGAKSVVCPGVTLNSHAILAVGSIANKDLEAYSIYQGNPAIKIRKRNIVE